MSCTCREVIESLIEYLSNDIATERRQVFEDHMAVCPDCEIYLNTYQEVVRLSRACCCLEAEECSEVPEHLVQTIVAACAGRQC